MSVQAELQKITDGIVKRSSKTPKPQNPKTPKPLLNFRMLSFFKKLNMEYKSYRTLALRVYFYTQKSKYFK